MRICSRLVMVKSQTRSSLCECLLGYRKLLTVALFLRLQLENRGVSDPDKNRSITLLEDVVSKLVVRRAKTIPSEFVLQHIPHCLDSIDVASTLGDCDVEVIGGFATIL